MNKNEEIIEIIPDDERDSFRYNEIINDLIVIKPTKKNCEYFFESGEKINKNKDQNKSTKEENKKNGEENKIEKNINKNINKFNKKEENFINEENNHNQKEEVKSTFINDSPESTIEEEKSNLKKNEDNNSNPNSKAENKYCLFSKRKISRFDFAQENPESSEINNIDKEIPDFIFDIIQRKFSRFSFFNRFNNEYNFSDSSLFENFLKKEEDNLWIRDIKDNLS